MKEHTLVTPENKKHTLENESEDLVLTLEEEVDAQQENLEQQNSRDSENVEQQLAIDPELNSEENAAIEAQIKTLIAETKEKAQKLTQQENSGEQLESLHAQFSKNEKAYIEKSKSRDGLKNRYEDARTDTGYVLKQVATFAQERGLSTEAPEALKGKELNEETLAVLKEEIAHYAERLFLDLQKNEGRVSGRNNPEKYKTVLGESFRYLDLVKQAQEQGDIPADLSAEDAHALITENITKLAWQDRIASENLLGDHGVRHLVGHNIKMTETLFDELSKRGQEVKAIDRLITHQVMIDHDLGYAMDPVREGVNSGDFSVDKGHNVLAAKFVSGRMENPNDAMGKVFRKEHLTTLHNGILEHDSSKVEFSIGNTSPEARRKNIESAIHVADNTHAFEDKLPELLYEYSDSLETLRLLKVAGETKNEALANKLKQRLADQIKDNPNYSEDDKEALVHAAEHLEPAAYKFATTRICGNKPEVSLDEKGKVNIVVQESAIHSEIANLFAQGQLDQLKKFIADLTGIEKDKVNLDTDSIDTENLSITLAIREGKASEKTDYQQNLEKLITNEKFMEFHEVDLQLSLEQKEMEEILKKGDPELIQSLANIYQQEKDIRRPEIIVQEELENIKSKRTANINSYVSI